MRCDAACILNTHFFSGEACDCSHGREHGMKNGYSAYKSARIDTADQGQLIVMAYDVAIKHCSIAVEKFDNEKLVEERTRHLLKAQDAITELMSSLNLEAGEVASNLYRLYDYVLRRLIHANARNDVEPVQEVLSYLHELREAWNYAADVVRKQAKAQINTASGEQKLAISG